VSIEVRDDGPGIPVDTVARLFKHDGLNVRGAGLALLLIRDVMAAHGGSVEVRSSIAPVGHGTTIRLTFPAR
jgi:signal transduction histidine kinase